MWKQFVVFVAFVIFTSGLAQDEIKVIVPAAVSPIETTTTVITINVTEKSAENVTTKEVPTNLTVGCPSVDDVKRAKKSPHETVCVEIKPLNSNEQPYMLCKDEAGVNYEKPISGYSGQHAGPYPQAHSDYHQSGPPSGYSGGQQSSYSGGQPSGYFIPHAEAYAGGHSSGYASQPHEYSPPQASGYPSTYSGGQQGGYSGGQPTEYGATHSSGYSDSQPAAYSGYSGGYSSPHEEGHSSGYSGSQPSGYSTGQSASYPSKYESGYEFAGHSSSYSAQPSPSYSSSSSYSNVQPSSYYSSSNHPSSYSSTYTSPSTHSSSYSHVQPSSYPTSQQSSYSSGYSQPSSYSQQSSYSNQKPSTYSESVPSSYASSYGQQPYQPAPAQSSSYSGSGYSTPQISYGGYMPTVPYIPKPSIRYTSTPTSLSGYAPPAAAYGGYGQMAPSYAPAYAQSGCAPPPPPPATYQTEGHGCGGGSYIVSCSPSLVPVPCGSSYAQPQPQYHSPVYSMPTYISPSNDPYVASQQKPVHVDKADPTVGSTKKPIITQPTHTMDDDKDEIKVAATQKPTSTTTVKDIEKIAATAATDRQKLTELELAAQKQTETIRQMAQHVKELTAQNNKNNKQFQTHDMSQRAAGQPSNSQYLDPTFFNSNKQW